MTDRFSFVNELTSLYAPRPRPPLRPPVPNLTPGSNDPNPRAYRTPFTPADRAYAASQAQIGSFGIPQLVPHRMEDAPAVAEGARQGLSESTGAPSVLRGVQGMQEGVRRYNATGDFGHAASRFVPGAAEAALGVLPLAVPGPRGAPVPRTRIARPVEAQRSAEYFGSRGGISINTPQQRLFNMNEPLRRLTPWEADGTHPGGYRNLGNDLFDEDEVFSVERPPTPYEEAVRRQRGGVPPDTNHPDENLGDHWNRIKGDFAWLDEEEAIENALTSQRPPIDRARSRWNVDNPVIKALPLALGGAAGASLMTPQADAGNGEGGAQSVIDPLLGAIGGVALARAGRGLFGRAGPMRNVTPRAAPSIQTVAPPAQYPFEVAGRRGDVSITSDGAVDFGFSDGWGNVNGADARRMMREVEGAIERDFSTSGRTHYTVSPLDEQRRRIFEAMASRRGWRMRPAGRGQFRLEPEASRQPDLPAPLDLSEPARMQRAREMGFDVDTPLYHGTDQDISAFRPNDGWYGNGVYLSRSADSAEPYTRRSPGQASGGGSPAPNIMPLYARGRLAPREEFDALNSPDALGDRLKMTTPAVQEELQRRGYAGVNIGGFDDEVVIFNPSDVRSPHASFAPGTENSSDLLAGLVPIGAGTALAATQGPPQRGPSDSGRKRKPRLF